MNGVPSHNSLEKKPGDGTTGGKQYVAAGIARCA
jgi:hypothetical protein